MVEFSSKATGKGGKGFSAEIRIDGLEDTLAALRALEPEVHKRLLAESKKAAGVVTRAASSRFAGTRHGKGDYRTRTAIRGKKAGLRIYAKGKDEAIFEFAGSRSGGHTPQGVALIDWLNSRFGKPGRFLWGAWDDEKAEFERNLKTSMAAAEQQLQARLNRTGVRF